MITADWGPQLRQIVTVAAAACALAYAMGYASGRWVHAMNDDLTRFACARHALQATTLQEAGAGAPMDDLSDDAIEAPAPEGAVVLTRAHMARSLVASGASRRQAARTIGVSERTVRRYLQEAVA